MCTTITFNWFFKINQENLKCVTKNGPFCHGRFLSTTHFDAVSLLSKGQVSSYPKQIGACDVIWENPSHVANYGEIAE